jgi:hypothetical protein
MFVLREFVVCVVVVFTFGVMFLTLCGIGYTVKTIGGMAIRAFRRATSLIPILRQRSMGTNRTGMDFNPIGYALLATSPS